MNKILQPADQKIMRSYGQKDGKNPITVPTATIPVVKTGGCRGCR